MPGEFSRVYSKKDLAKILSTAALLGIVFMSLAPCSPIMFYGIHFNIAQYWIITQNNFIGIFLAILSSILLIISYFHIHNLTQDKTFDFLKDQIIGDDKENDEKSTAQKLWTTKDIVTNGNLMFLLSTEAFLSFSYYQMDLIIAMTAVRTYQLTLAQFGVLTACVILLAIFILYTIQRKLLGNGLNIYFLYMFGFAIIFALDA